jgi:hypothetical protein
MQDEDKCGRSRPVMNKASSKKAHSEIKSCRRRRRMKISSGGKAEKP